MKKKHSEEFVMLNNNFIDRNHGCKDKKSGLFLVRPILIKILFSQQKHKNYRFDFLSYKLNLILPHK